MRPHIVLGQQNTLASFWFGLNSISVLEQKEYKSVAESSIDVDNEMLRRISTIELSMTTLYNENFPELPRSECAT